MRRTTLIFRLSDHYIQRDLLHEFTLHPGVTASAVVVAGAPAIAVETADAPGALWDVRATVGMFDDDAQEMAAQ